MTYTAHQIADDCGVTYETVARWAQRWHGEVGSGNRRPYTDIDAKVARAWVAIDRERPGVNGVVLCVLAETAIRHRPRRWLALSMVGASTHDTAEEAVQEWQHDRYPFVRLIDLENDQVGDRPKPADASLRALDHPRDEPFTGAVS
jgi:hypothetical protein